MATETSACQTLLQALRQGQGNVSVKEGCASGDCGACTVVVARQESRAAGHTQVHWQAVNSCIRLAGAVDDAVVFTAQDLPRLAQSQADSTASDVLHPVQQAMIDCHASQCGFCTPGFVMSLFALYMNTVAKGVQVGREAALEALSGNLCRCTGYGPILEAALKMGDYPIVRVDEDRLFSSGSLGQQVHAPLGYHRPKSLAELMALREDFPDALLTAGSTDVGLWVTKQHKTFSRVIDLSAVHELHGIGLEKDRLCLGAAEPLSRVFPAIASHWPAAHDFLDRFAGRPIRESATLGGNIANGSPIGDSMPLLLALDAELVLVSAADGPQSALGQRRVALKDFYTGYKRNVLAQTEVITQIRCALPTPQSYLAAYKISKRFEDDISAACMVVWLEWSLKPEGRIMQSVRIGLGGLAATPVRAFKTEAALIGHPVASQSFERAAQVLAQEVSPISDMRASAEYRRTVAANLIRKLGHTLHSGQSPRLELA